MVYARAASTRLLRSAQHMPRLSDPANDRLLAKRRQIEEDHAKANPRSVCRDVYGPFLSYKDEVMSMHLMDR